MTEDATVSAVGTDGTDGTPTITGSHTWARAGTYTVHVLASDSRSDVVASFTVTVT